MSIRILGLSAYYHDSAAALLVDGRIVAAAQEERFTRIKHDAAFPSQAVDYCLREAHLTREDIDHVVFYEKPLLKFDRLLETYIRHAPSGLRSFMKAMPQWVKTKLHLPREIRKSLGDAPRKRIVFARHHESHAASAFFPSPFEEAAILTLDGVGEWDTTTVGFGRGHEIHLLQSLRFPHSLGLLYSALTYFTGFRVNSGEYKLMGLAPYGEPRFKKVMLEKLVDLKPDGSLRLDLSYFNFCTGLTMTSRRMQELLDGPPRRPESRITQREMDIAASIQAVTEEAVLRMARHARQVTGMKSLCLAGGVALNCVANGRLLRSGVFEDLWIQPASGDAGGALGAALLTYHQLLGQERHPKPGDSMEGSFLGPSFSNEEIATRLRAAGMTFQTIEEESELLNRTVQALEAGKVVGWFQGRMEFGPRSLGARSILGDPRHPDMQSRMNLQIKYRESFRPFAPSVLRESAREYFDLDRDSPYMLLVAEVAESQRHPIRDGDPHAAHSQDLNERLRVQRSLIPAVTHVDLSARVQTVDATRHGRFHRLLKRFQERTGCAVLINTSFNLRGEPPVHTPEEACQAFLTSEMDVLVIGDHFLVREEQTLPDRAEREARIHSFQPD